MTASFRPPRARARLLATLLLIAGAAACGDQIQGPSITTPVTIRDNEFSPRTVLIARGGSIRWSNNGANIHTSVADDGSWSSGNLGPGETFTRTFPNTGVFGYRCAIHAGMNGSVIVD